METTTNIQQSYLTFLLSEEHFALSVDSVINIQELVRITEVPKAPSFMKGVINLRGEALPVIDLRLKLGIPAAAFTQNTCIIVIDVPINEELIRLGVIVDAVLDVTELKEEEIKPPPTMGGKFNADFIVGVAESEDQFLMVLNIEKIFNEDEVNFIMKKAKSAK